MQRRNLEVKQEEKLTESNMKLGKYKHGFIIVSCIGGAAILHVVLWYLLPHDIFYSVVNTLWIAASLATGSVIGYLHAEEKFRREVKTHTNSALM